MSTSLVVVPVVLACVACGSPSGTDPATTPGSAGGPSAPSSASERQASLPADYTLSVFAGTNQTDDGHLPASGPATSETLGPQGVGVDAAGNVYIADDGNSVIEKVTPSGHLSVIAGNGNPDAPVPGPATASPLYEPDGVAVDHNGDIYIADTGNYLVEKVTPAGQLSVIAGTGEPGSPVPGPATASPIEPAGVAVDSAGTVFVADPTNNVIEKIASTGQLSVVDTNGESITPHGVAVDATGNLYIANDFNVAKITPGGVYSVIAGSGARVGAPVPGPARSSPIAPDAVAVDQSGDVFVADGTNEVIERISASGDLAVIAGTGQEGNPIPGPADQSPLPTVGDAGLGIAVGPAGAVYLTRPLVVLKLTP
jgi:hypothetical protein